MDAFLRDLRQSARALRRAPAFAAVALLTLGLGLGATTAIYSLVDRVVIDPLAYPEADRLVRLYSQTSEGTWNLSRAQYALYRDEARTIDQLAGFNFGQATVLSPRGPERVGVWLGTAGFFRLVDARPALGRLIDEEDDELGAPRVAVLSWEYWRRAFGGDSTVLGRTLSVEEGPVEIVGVMRPGLELPEHVPDRMHPEVWLPLQLNLTGQFWNSHMEFRTMARLAPGVTAEAATRELADFDPRLVELYPDAYSDAFLEKYAFRVEAHPLKQAIVGDVATNLWVLLAGTGLVLLIACANIANLFLVRAEERRQELALRVALGAGRSSLLRYFLAESLVVTAGGALVALLVTQWGVSWLVTGAAGTLPRPPAAGLDGSVLLFLAALSALVALALALLPAVRGARVGRSAAELVEGGRGATVGRQRLRGRAVLVAGQLGLALVLLVGAGLLLESFRRIRAVDPGIEPSGVLAIHVALPDARYADEERRWAFYDALLERVRAIPGVASAGAVGELPFGGGFGCTVQGFGEAEVMARVRDAQGTLCAGQTSATDGYFESMGIPLLAGRTTTPADNESPGTGAVVVSRAFAEKFWPGEDPIGRMVAPGGRTEPPFYRVVGVVGDVFSGSPAEPPAVAIYYPVVPIPGTRGLWSSGINLVVKSAGPAPLSLFPQIRAAALELDGAIPLANPRTMDAMVSESVSGLSFTMTLLGVAALAALLLAAIGVYGVLAYTIERRTNEIGVRIALGAVPGQVERMVVSGSLRITVVGLLLGVVGALALTRFLASLLFQVRPTQPAAYVAAALLLTAVALLASWLPARRAARVDPVEALRAR